MSFFVWNRFKPPVVNDADEGEYMDDDDGDDDSEGGYSDDPDSQQDQQQQQQPKRKGKGKKPARNRRTLKTNSAARRAVAGMKLKRKQ